MYTNSTFFILLLLKPCWDTYLVIFSSNLLGGWVGGARAYYFRVPNHATLWFNFQDCKISGKARWTECGKNGHSTCFFLKFRSSKLDPQTRGSHAVSFGLVNNTVMYVSHWYIQGMTSKKKNYFPFVRSSVLLSVPKEFLAVMSSSRSDVVTQLDS